MCNEQKLKFSIFCHIAKSVNEGFFYDGGRIRGIPVQIGGTSYVPPLPIESVVVERINEIRRQQKDTIDIAMELSVYCIYRELGNNRRFEFKGDVFDD